MIVVYGSVNIDLIGHAPRLMRPGETVLGTALEIAPGGKGANQALAASRAGADVRMIGCVGHDDFAGRALELLLEAGVDLSHVRRMDRHTGTALIVVDAAGENMITVLPGANERLGAAALEAAGIGPEDTLLVQLETPLEGVVSAAVAAREKGARVIANLAPHAQVPEPLLQAASVLVMNETELAGTLAMLGASAGTPEIGLTLLARRFETVAVATLGANGAVAVAPDGAVTAVAGCVIAPVDTTGAGDTFVGYLASGLAEGRALADALARANAAAALACLAHGAQPAIPDGSAVDAFIGRQA